MDIDCAKYFAELGCSCDPDVGHYCQECSVRELAEFWIRMHDPTPVTLDYKYQYVNDDLQLIPFLDHYLVQSSTDESIMAIATIGELNRFLFAIDVKPESLQTK